MYTESKKRSSVMKHQFSEVPKAEIPRSSFDRSHGLKTTFDSGFLIPILVDEALPGDTFNLRLTALARLATPIFPIMDNMYMETFFFAVPNRLLWDNWEKFNGAQDDPGDSTDFTVPTVTGTNYSNTTVFDYMGLPTGVASAVAASSLHFRAHNLIYNQWFRDENFQNSLPVDTGDGPDNVADYKISRRGKRHDYFTSSLPWPQKGDSVSLPLGSAAPVSGLGLNEAITFPNAASDFKDATGLGQTYPFWTSTTTDAFVMRATGSSSGAIPDVYADLSAATAATINQLRQAFQVQKILERDARGGTRYTEIIKAHFGVSSPDSRLQRSEFLGGGSTPIGITPIAQTSETDPAASPQANLAAIGTAQINNHGFTKSFTEHCVILGYVNVRADITYQQGLDRMWSRSTRYDFYWPALSHIGEQAVLNQEIFTTGLIGDLSVFGYQERYAEYRYKQSKITGKFRSNDPDTLDAWHLSQDFAGVPILNDAFIEDTPPVERVIAVATEPEFIFDGYFSMRCARPMPLYGVPGLIDHF